MIQLFSEGAYLVDGTTLVKESEAEALKQLTGEVVSKEEASKNTIAYGILRDHNTSGNMEKLHVLTNSHNSLCAVGGTINEDDHMFGLTAAKKYGGVYVPPHQAVIHQFAREMLAGGGKMILGSDSHTRYGALGTMARGEGGACKAASFPDL